MDTDQSTPVLIAEGAGFRIRALARMVDITFGLFLGLIGGVVAAVLLAILELTGAVAPGWQTRTQEMSAGTLALSLFGAFSYHFLCEGIHGSSLGKLVFKLRVVHLDGSPCSMKGSLIRGLAFHLDGLVFGLVAYASMQRSALNQRLGDVWGKTLVIETSQSPDGTGRSITWFLVALFLGSAFWMLSLVMGMVLRAMH